MRNACTLYAKKIQIGIELEDVLILIDSDGKDAELTLNFPEKQLSFLGQNALKEKQNLRKTLTYYQDLQSQYESIQKERNELKEKLEEEEIIDISQTYRKVRDEFINSPTIIDINQRLSTEDHLMGNTIQMDVEMLNKNEWDPAISALQESCYRGKD